jgi:hypothetical protein
MAVDKLADDPAMHAPGTSLRMTVRDDIAVPDAMPAAADQALVEPPE